jgi:autotransporter-associated beta strand protein
VGSGSIEANGSGALALSGSVSGSGIRTLTLAGTSTALNTISGVIGSTGVSVVKTNAGVWRLSGANTYTGSTAILGGQLHVSAGNINNTSRVTVNGTDAEFKYNSATAYTQPLTISQGTISGTGTISASGGVSIGTNAILSPGNSPGIQAYTTGMTWAAGGTYLWEINDWTGGAGTAFDQVAVTSGTLSITALTDTNPNRYRILITSLSGTSNVPGTVPNFDGNTNRSFPIATYTTISGFDASKFWLDTSAFTNTYSGSFTISDSGTAVMLNYIAPGPAYVSTTYTLAATAGASAIRVNGTTGITATVTNTGTGTADSLAVTGLGVSVTSPGSVTISPNSGTAANTNGNVVGSGTFTGSSAGAYTFTPSASGTNVNLGTAASLTSTGSTTVTVYNPAVATTSGSVNLGTVIVGSTSAWSQAISITNSAPNDGFSEKLNAAFGTLSGVTTNSGSIGLLAAGSTNNTAMAVALSTGSVGNLNGTAQLTFQTDGQGTSGLAAAALDPQTVNVYGTVLDHATSSLAGTLLTSTTISLGTWDYSTTSWQTGSGTGVFSIYNIASSFGAQLTADLSLLSVSGSANGFSTNLDTYSDIAGGSSRQFSIFADTTGWTTSGTQTVTFTISTSDKTSVAGATPSNTLTVIANVVVVPEPATIAMAGIAAACAGFVAYRRRRPKA